MMRASHTLRAATVVCWLAASGCTALREIPRGEYAGQSERRRVAVDTREGQHYEFDYAQFASDTLTGFRQRDEEGGIEEYDSTSIPLESVAKLSARGVDWYRTVLIGGLGIAAILTAALTRSGNGGGATTPGPCGPRPCPD